MLEDRLTPSFGTPSWVEQGPGPITNGQTEGLTAQNNPVAGAVEAIAAHPTNADIAVIATVNGGIWTTANATASAPTWTPRTDNFSSLSFGAIAYSPVDSNVLYAGTGSFSSGAGAGGPAIGVLKSTDGGATWAQVGGSTLNNRPIRSVLPTTLGGGQVVFAASVNGGLYRSANGGTSFTQISGTGGLPTGAAFNIVADGADANTFYVGVGIVSATQGVYRSTDGGLNWTNASTGITGLGGAAVRINVAAHYDPGDSSKALYAAVIRQSDGELSGVFRSTNGGTSWTAMDTVQTTEPGGGVGLHPSLRPIGSGVPDDPGGQGSIHFSMLADRTNEFVVYVGGDRQPGPGEGGIINFPNSIGANNYSGRHFRGDASQSSGNQWYAINAAGTAANPNDGANGTSPHADSREMVWDANGNILEGDDGGIYRLTNPNAVARTWSSVNGNLRVTEFYSVAYDSVNNFVFGGTQDVGSARQTAAGGFTWTEPGFLQGDGATAHVDDVTIPGSSIHYASAQFLGNFSRQTFNSVGGITSTVFPALTVQGTGQPLDAVDGTVQFIQPWAINAVAPTRLLFGTTIIYESIDQGNNLTRPNGTTNVGTVNAMAYGGKLSGTPNPDVAWIGTSHATNKLLLRTAAAGAFNNLSAYTAAGGGSVRDIVLDPDNWQRAYVLDVTGKVFRSTDAGTTWVNITSTLGTLSSDLRSIEIYSPTTAADDEAIFVAGLGGVFATDNPQAGPGTTWIEFGTGLPNYLVRDVRYYANDNVLLVGGFGRGAWTVPNLSTFVLSGDRFEANDNFAAATNLGSLGDRAENDLSIHTANNDDYYRLTAAATGNLTVSVSFLNSQGNVDLFVYDGSQAQIGSSTTTNNFESVTVAITSGQTYYIKVIGAAGAINPDYDMIVDGPNPSALGTTLFNFDGINFTSVNPSDSTGDVGLNHYIQAVNASSGTRITIYDKSTGTPVVGFNNILMNSLVGGVPAGFGDPNVIYDQLANRWILAEFSGGVTNAMSIFVSQTSDPTGAWYHYDVVAPNFPDYFKIGVMPDAYYITSNESSTAVPVYALNRSKMLAGQALGANDLQRKTATGLAGFGFEAFAPADNDGAGAPSGSPGYFMRHRDDEVHNPGTNNPTQDFVELWQFTVDFNTPANSTFTQVANIATAEFDSNIFGVGSTASIPQPGTGQRLDPVSEVIMNRLQYRNFGTYETLVGNFITDADTDHGAVRWFELRKVGAGSWTLYQEGTISPDAHHRWMGSLAMDGAGNIALGYSISSTTEFPGLRYLGRRPGDTLGAMPDGEHTIVSGASSQASNRWGDYFSMNVDPVDDRTYWYVGTYMPAGGSWRTRIASFKFDNETTAPIVLSINPAGGSTISSSANIDVTFSEPVLGVDATDMVLSGSGAVGASVGTPTNQGGNTWRFPISGVSAGTLDISLAPDVNDIEDIAGNDLSPRPTTWSYATSVVDTIPPSAPVVTGLSSDTGESSVDELTNDTTPTFTWTASTDTGGSGLLGYWWAVDDSTPETGGTFTTSLNATLPVTADGAHVFYVNAVDNAGNVSAVGSLAFTIDTAGPTVTSTTPLDGSFVAAGPSQILVNFSDAMDRVSALNLLPSHLTLGGAGRGSAAVIGATWVDADTARFIISGAWGTGPVTVQLTGAGPRDRAGNSVTPYTTGDFVIDTLGPTAPAVTGMTNDTGESNSDSLTNDTTPTFSWNASTDAASGVAGYFWAVDDATPDTGGTFTASLTATPTVTANGPHTFYVRAQDAVGNLGPVGQFTFTIDTAAPTVASTVPADGGTVTSGPTEILVNFSENMDRTSPSNLLPTDLTLGGAAVGGASVTAANWVDADTARFTISGAWGLGQVTVQLTSGSPRDQAGNGLTNYTIGDFTIIDGDPPSAPTVTGLSDDTGASNSDEITSDPTPTFSWNASTDTGGSGLAGYWWAVGDATPETGGTFTTLLNATPIVAINGDYTFYVRAQDVAGNLSALGSLAFTIDTFGPTVNGTTPFDGAVVTSGPSEILVDFSEAMGQQAGNLLPAHLTLGGAGLGSATVTGANWVDADTARFTIAGAWGLGLVTVQLTGPLPMDLAGNALISYTTGDFTIIDASAPSAPVITGLTNDTGESTADAITSDTTPTFNWNASTDTGGSGVAGYYWSVDDDTPETGGTLTAGLTAISSVLADGGHVFYVRAIDGAGNLGSVAVLPFTIDTAGPTVASTTPLDGSTVNTQPTEILINFSEAMDRISAGNLLPSHLTLGGAGLGSVTVTGANWVNAQTARFTVSGAWSVGLVTVQLTGGVPRDRAGNALVNYTVGDFTLVDTTPPTSPVVTGLTTDTGESNSDRLTSDTSPTFTWSASTDAGGSLLSGYWWSVDDPTPESGGTFTTILSATANVTAGGPHVFYVRAQDGAGNLSTPAAQLTFEIDTTAPIVANMVLGDGSVVSGGPNQILITFSERMEITDLTGTLILGGPGLGTTTVATATWLGNTTAKFTFGGTWGVGQVTVQMTADSLRDSAGNILTDFTDGDFTIPPPRPGSTSLTSPSGTGTDDTPTFNWTAASNATSYELYVINSVTSAPVLSLIVSSTTFTPTTPFVLGEYLAWVRGRGPGGIGDWSLPTAFSVIVPPVNYPPQLQPIANQAVLQTDASKIVAINSSDPNNDPLTPSAQVRTVSKLAFDLDQQLGLMLNGSYYTNFRGLNEKYIYSSVESAWYFIIPDGRSPLGAEFRKFDRNFASLPFNPNDHVLVGRLSIDYYNNPALLHDAVAPGAQPTITATFAGNPPNTLTLAGYSSFLGMLEVRVTVSEPLGGTATESFLLEVHNRTATTIQSIGNRTVSHAAGVFNVAFVAGDPNGDVLTQLPPTILTTAKLARDLDQQLLLSRHTSGYFTNFRGAGEKYIQSGLTGGWFFLISDANDPNAAELHQWNGSLATSPLVGRFGIAYLNDPSLLHEAPVPPPEPVLPAAILTGTHPNFNISQSFPTSFVGDLQVTARVTNGTAVGSQTFLVHIVNSAPIITPTGDANGNYTIARGTSLNIDVIDSDSEPVLTVTASALTSAALAYQLDLQFGFEFRTSYYQNIHGRDEKWIWSSIQQQWFSIQPNGELRRGSSGNTFGELIAVLDISFWNDPSLLWNAQPPGAVQNVAIVTTSLNATTRRVTFTPHPAFSGRIYATITAFDGIVMTRKTFYIDVT